MSAKPEPSPLLIRLSALIAVLLTVTVVRYPQVAFSASLEGLKIWFDIVLPALLPFFAMSEILMGLGVVHFIGVLLEPLMRPLFQLPGTGAFAVAMGLASGYPIGAKITGQLHREGLCTGTEGERLIALANTADPLFMVGAVAVGMFGLEELGWTIACAHYLSVLLVGLAMGLIYGRRDAVARSGAPQQKKNMLARALKELELARLRDDRPIGQLFGDAVKDSFTSMLFIGGCIMIFSVLGRIMDVAGITAIMQKTAGAILEPLSIDQNTLPALLRGIVEITIGCEAASKANSPLLARAMATSFIIGWSGLSVHAQVATMIHGTDIRLGPYILARALHGVVAAILTALLWRPIGSLAASETLAPLPGLGKMDFLARLALSLRMFILAIGILLVIGLLTHLFRGIKIIRVRAK